MSDGPDAAGGLDGDAGDGDFGGIDGDFGDFEGGEAGGLDLDLEIDLGDALMVSFDGLGDFDEWSDPLCDRDGNSIADMLHFDRNCRPNHGRDLTAAQKKLIEKVGKDPSRRLFAAHVTGHGYLDVVELFAKVATRMGCNRIDTVTPNFPSIDEKSGVLFDWNDNTPPFKRRKVPSGWYPDAPGSTRLTRQFWQIKKSNGLFRRDPEPHRRFDRQAGMVFEVVLTTWSYHEPSDFETRLQILIKPFPEFAHSFKKWGIKARPLVRYQAKARELVDEVARLIYKVDPHWHSRVIRADIKERLRLQREAEEAKKAERSDKDSPPPVPRIVLFPDKKKDSGDGSPANKVECDPGFRSGADMGAVLGGKSKTVDIEFPL